MCWIYRFGIKECIQNARYGMLNAQTAIEQKEVLSEAEVAELVKASNDLFDAAIEVMKCRKQEEHEHESGSGICSNG